MPKWAFGVLAGCHGTAVAKLYVLYIDLVVCMQNVLILIKKFHFGGRAAGGCARTPIFSTTCVLRMWRILHIIMKG